MSSLVIVDEFVGIPMSHYVVSKNAPWVLDDFFKTNLWYSLVDEFTTQVVFKIVGKQLMMRLLDQPQPVLPGHDLVL